jgi:hypothetical protein
MNIQRGTEQKPMQKSATSKGMEKQLRVLAITEKSIKAKKVNGTQNFMNSANNNHHHMFKMSSKANATASNTSHASN